MVGLLFWLAICGYLLFCVLRGRKQDVETYNKTVDEYVEHVKNDKSYSLDTNAGIYHDWRGRPRDVITGKVAVETEDFETGERWIVDKNHRFIRNVSEQEWEIKIKEGLKNGNDLILIDENRGHKYKRFNYVEGRIYVDVESKEYCVIREFFESQENYYKRREYNKDVFKSPKHQWELCRETYSIVVDIKNGHFLRFKDKNFVPESILPLEPRIKKFNKIMDMEWLKNRDYLNRVHAGKNIGKYAYKNIVEF